MFGTGTCARRGHWAHDCARFPARQGGAISDPWLSDLRTFAYCKIPVGTSFQFRATASSEVAVVGVTMPPWPGDDEAVAVPGAWDAQTGATSSPTRITPGSTTAA